jgi:hypothetical protein
LPYHTWHHDPGREWIDENPGSRPKNWEKVSQKKRGYISGSRFKKNNQTEGGGWHGTRREEWGKGD